MPQTGTKISVVKETKHGGREEGICSSINEAQAARHAGFLPLKF